MVDEIIIREVRLSEIDKVKKYILAARRELYPMLDSDMQSGDLPKLENLYFSNDNSNIFIALNNKDMIIGSIGIKPYDNRFESLNYTGYKTAEVVKLFVNKEFRKNRIGTELVNKMFEEAARLGYKILYLHTHPFLDGALSFWQKNGFKVIHKETQSNMITIHMDRKI